MMRAVHRPAFAAGFRFPPAVAACPAALNIAALMLLMLLALGLYSLSRGSYPLPAPTLARTCWRCRRLASSRALFCLISACRGS